MRPDHSDFVNSLKLAAIAVASAMLTATLVIGAGRAVLEHTPQEAAAPAIRLLQAAVR